MNRHGKKHHMRLGNINTAQFYFITFIKHNSEAHIAIVQQVYPNKQMSLVKNVHY